MNAVYQWRHAPEADFAVIGDPIAHSLSPQMHTAAYAALSIRKTYLAIHVPAEEVLAALDNLREIGYQGVNVTVPHKAAVIPWLTEVEVQAKTAQSVNTIDLQTRRGINTDAPGFLETLHHYDLRPPARILMLGAGGSARALALALEREGYALSIYNRTRARAETLVSDLQLRAEVVAEPRAQGFQMVLNTTSASLTEQALPIDWSDSAVNALAYDLAYKKNGPTTFLKAAEDHGLRTADGREMLVAQGALALEWWLGVKAPRDVMKEAIL